MEDNRDPEKLVDYDEWQSKTSNRAFKISGLAIAIAAVICLGLIVLVVAMPGGL